MSMAHGSSEVTGIPSPSATPEPHLPTQLEPELQTKTQTAPPIAICGAGPVGLALAALLVGRGVEPGRIILLDARPLERATADPRSIALSYGSSQLLQGIGAWPVAASTIGQIHVSRRGHFGRTLIDCEDHGLPALGYVARYGTLVDALAKVCDAAGIRAMRPAVVAALAEDDREVRLQLTDGTTIHAAIVVQAEGGLFADQPLKIQRRDYEQTAIVAEVGVSKPLLQRAFERFTDEGPLALLPMPQAAAGDAGPARMMNPVVAGGGPSPHYALVWCVRPSTAERLMALPDGSFLAALEHAFGERVGRFVQVSARSTYPLGLNAAPAATARTVAIGNAAQTLHPVAGQGLNLGLRDAAVLARLLAGDATPAALPRFIAERRPDRSVTIGVTDVMARIFASAPDGALSQALLGLSLGIVDGISPARHLLAGQMMFGVR